MKRIALILLLATMIPTTARGLDAGTGVADITPDVTAFKVPMAGYGARLGRPAKGVHDPLHAKILFLRDAKIQLALIACDLRSITPELKTQVLAKTADVGLTPDTLVYVRLAHARRPLDVPRKILADAVWHIRPEDRRNHECEHRQRRP